MGLQSEASRRVGMTAGLTVLVVGTMGAAYMVSQALRNSVGVIAPNLAADLGLSAGQIGLLSSAFFITFALVQIPLGVCLDRFGSRPCMLACSGLVILASLMFAWATTPAGLIAARALMGIGASSYLMAPLAFYARNMPPSRFGTLTGVQIGLGTLGTIFATAPLAWSAASFGWRMTFVLIAAAMAIAGLLIALVVPAEPAMRTERRAEGFREIVAGSMRAFRTRSVGALFLMQLSAYSSFVLIVGLWGGPYLTHIYGYGLQERGDLLLLVALGQTAGSFVYGPMARLFGSHKVPVLIGSAGTAVLLGLMAVFGTVPRPVLPVWLFGFGLVSAYTAALVAHGKALFPPDIVARGLTLLNIGTMGGVFLSQAVTGAVINAMAPGAEAYPLDAYRAVFALQALWIIITVVPYVGANDPRP